MQMSGLFSFELSELFPVLIMLILIQLQACYFFGLKITHVPVDRNTGRVDANVRKPIKFY